MAPSLLRRSTLVAVLPALMWLLAACGGGEEPAPTAAEAEPTTGDVGTADADTSTQTDTAVVDGTHVALDNTEYLGSYTRMDTDFGTMVTVTVGDATRTIETNALPDHDTGEFPNPGNPNAISAQDVSWEFPLEGVYTGEAIEARVAGVAVNGVKFEPGTAETVSCETGETHRVEAIQDLFDLGLDFNNAHVQPTGEYHYHGASPLLVDAYASSDDLVHVGFAADGFLIYYSKSGAYASGYALRTENRTGTTCSISLPGGDTFDLDGSSPDGTYTSDWVFDPTSGDLDECNGTTIDGTYVYVMTDDYPYISRCLNGEAAATGGPGPGAGPGQGQRPGAGADGQAGRGGPDLSEAAAQLGISVDELSAALGGPPPDVDAAAATLGVSVDELIAVLPRAPGGRGQRPAAPARDMTDEPEDSNTAEEAVAPEDGEYPGPDLDLFFEGALAENVETVACTLSGGASTTCYRITVVGHPVDTEIGPFCPETTETTADDAGLWFDGDDLYDLDGEFIVGLADLYQDDNWRLYNDDGSVNITDTPEAFEAAARPNVAPEYQNHCVEGRIEWLDGGEPVPTTMIVPTNPTLAASPAGSGRGDLGITLNGVTIAPAAPVNAILGAYTIAAFDDCGGHINPIAGYHLHGAVGCGEVAVDGHEPIFGYAADGFGIYSPAELDVDDGVDVEDGAGDGAALDDCGGHTDDDLGYHYHSSPAAENAVINCLSGQTPR